MPVTEIIKNIDDRTLTIVADFAAPVERVWAIYADPRQLERIWGPPGYPATFVDHDLRAGARVTHYMTSPEGERFAGYWEVTDVDEPHRFAFLDGFADPETFTPNPDLPVGRNTYTFEGTPTGTRASYTVVYESVEALQTVLDMGMEEGATLAINQIDHLLAS